VFFFSGFTKPSPYSCIVAVFALILLATGVVGMYFGWQGGKSEKKEVQEQAEYIFETGMTSFAGGLLLVCGVFYFIRKNSKSDL
jgi:hypothetical protein